MEKTNKITIGSSKTINDLKANKGLERQGVNTSGVARLYKSFKEYIGFPSFYNYLEGTSKYSNFQFDTLRTFLFASTEPAMVIRNIKDAISFLNSQEYNEYNWEGFEEFSVKFWEEEEVNKITNQQFNITNYLENAAEFHKAKPYFYDKAGLFWLWDWEQKKYSMSDEIDIMNKVDKLLNFTGQTITSKVKGNYLEALKRVGRLCIPDECPKTWIQFSNKIWDFREKKLSDVKCSYFMTNPIPWKIGKSQHTPVMDKLFKDWVGEKYVQTLYEIIAYCCVMDYPIHRLFCLVGGGRNGKSQFQKIVQKFIGVSNISSTELDLLIDNRFESAKLYKKLVCTLGETNFGVMKKTSLLKKLTGGDLIGYEFKNKTPFDDYNYAKIIVNSNSLPSSLDTSDGFYRRWLIIEFPNEFPEGKDIIETIPDEEYHNLAKKVCLLLPRLMDSGMFTNEGSIDERRRKYIMSSNPLPLFLESFCNKDVEAYVKSNELYNAYILYLNSQKKRKVSRKEFFDILADEGLFQVRACKNYITDRYIECVELNPDWKVAIYKK